MAKTLTPATIIARGTSNAAFTQLTGCSATRSGTTATLTKTSHGRSNGDKVLIQGFGLEEFNGLFTISNVTSNTFDYTIKQDPGANPSGTPGTVDLVTLGAALNLTTAYGARIFGGFQNGTTGPGVAPQLWMGTCATGTEADYVWRQIGQGDTVANSWTPIPITLDEKVGYVNFAVCRNTNQAVDCFFLAEYVTAL